MHAHRDNCEPSSYALVTIHISDNMIFLTTCVSVMQYGPVHQIIIPRPGAASGVGKVILNFGDVQSAIAAQRVMNGRKFAGRTVIATFMTDDQLAAGSLD